MAADKCLVARLQDFADALTMGRNIADAALLEWAVRELMDLRVERDRYLDQLMRVSLESLKEVL